MSQIKPKTDRKPGSSRFAEMLDPKSAMTNTSNDTGVSQSDAMPTAQVERKTPKPKQEGQSIRIDKGLWLRLKSLQLHFEEQGQRQTLQDLINEALAAFLTSHGK